MRLATSNHLRCGLTLYDNATHARRTAFLSWCLSLHLALLISRVCGHRWSKDMRFAAANTPPPASCSMSAPGRATHVVLPHTPYFFIILIVSSSAIGRQTTGVVKKNPWLRGNVGTSFPIDRWGVPKRLAECPLPARTASRRAVLFGLDAMCTWRKVNACIIDCIIFYFVKTLKKRRWFFFMHPAVVFRECCQS